MTIVDTLASAGNERRGDPLYVETSRRGIVGWLGRILVVLIALLGAHRPPLVAADTVTVCADGCDFVTIQAAVDAASGGEMISVLDEVHTESGIIVDEDVAIVGGNIAGTIVQAAAEDVAASDRVFEVAAGASVIVQDLTIRYGQVTGTLARGGGLLNYGSLRLERVTVTANRALGTNGLGGDAEGGGVYSEGPLRVINCTISGNRAHAGSGG